MRPIVIEHRLHELVCHECGKGTRAARLVGVPRWHPDTRVMATVAMLSGKFRLTRRELP